MNGATYDWPPTAKMQASGVSGAMTVVVIWCLRQFWKVEIPPEIASAITVIFSFIAGYFAPRDKAKPGAG
jgi:hypothetical protein